MPSALATIEGCVGDLGVLLATVVCTVLCRGVRYIKSSKDGARTEMLRRNNNDKWPPSGPMNQILRAVLGARLSSLGCVHAIRVRIIHGIIVTTLRHDVCELSCMWLLCTSDD